MPKQHKPKNDEDGFTVVENKKPKKEKPSPKKYVNDTTRASNVRNVYVPSMISQDDIAQNTFYHIPHRNTNTTQLEYYNQTTTPGDNMELSSTWTVWTHDNKNDDWSVESYEPIYKISNIGEMWRFLNVFGNLNNTDYQYFIMRNGIMPIWEDNNNRDGCICSIMLECTNRAYKHVYNEICIDAFIAFSCLVFNESFVSNNLDINGLCYSSKQRNVLIKFWVKNHENNKNFNDKLPIKLLTYLSDTIDAECKGHSGKQTESKISVQIKPIVPVY